MKHLFSYSVYQSLTEYSDDLIGSMRALGFDGMELLTSYDPVDQSYYRGTETVHLPYSTDWLAAWENRPYPMEGSLNKFYMYGRDRDEVVSNIRRMISVAAPLKPGHGVIHASNIDIPELIRRDYSRDSRQVLSAFAEMMNESVSGLPGGEPPFRLAFENLWWPGLKLHDDSDFRYLESKIEFENWGICLDTGHLMNSLPKIYSEEDGIEAVLKVIEGYSHDLIDRIGAVHFHYSASAKYRETFEEESWEDGAVTDFISTAYPHVSRLDQHRPYSLPECKTIVDFVQPDYLIHELGPGDGDPFSNFIQQRKLLD